MTELPSGRLARAARLAVVAGCVLAIGLLVVGWRPVVLLSDSMSPTMGAGSLVVSRPVAVTGLAVGDVVTVTRSGAPPVTHRVVDVDLRADGSASLRLRGDGNAAPDRARVVVTGRVLRAVTTVPLLGRLLTVPAAAWAGVLVLTLGVVAARRSLGAPPDVIVGTDDDGRDDGVAAAGAEPDGGVDPGVEAPPDPRAVALDATLEELAERLPVDTVTALARVRAGALAGLPSVEGAAGVDALDDGALFVLIALADADAAALVSIPATSSRTTDALALVDRWWAGQRAALPRTVGHALVRWLGDDPHWV